tara:strand:+ start:456 stop:1691 length:1236 start_codon:yes stop_codon:yes gene_type:complete
MSKNEKFNQLPDIIVSWDKLLLDPNNPRLHSSTDPEIDLGGEEGFEYTLDVQDNLQTKMSEYDISDLTIPMKEKGFIFKGIPPLLVKKIGTNNHYLTIEGNRRLTAIRHLMYNEAESLTDEVKNSFERITVVDCSSLNAEEIEEYLGMIHIGGTKPWDLMPKAKYLFSQFIRELCRQHGLSPTPERFEDKYINRNFEDLLDAAGKRALKTVAAQSSVKQADVKKSIAIFRLFIQVNNYLESIGAEKIDAKMASFFDETFGTPILRMYFEIDERNLIFSELGLENWVDVCCKTPDNMGHAEQEKKGPVIRQATAGDSNLRDFKKIIDKDPTTRKEYVGKVIHERRKASEVLGDLQSILNKVQLETVLTTIKKQFDKIDLGQIEEQWSERAKTTLDQIKLKFKDIDDIRRNRE